METGVFVIIMDLESLERVFRKGQGEGRNQGWEGGLGFLAQEFEWIWVKGGGRCWKRMGKGRVEYEGVGEVANEGF